MHLSKRIAQQEAVLNKSQALLNQLESLVADWDALHPQFVELMNYYGSSQWHADLAADSAGELQGVPRGVLSEDAIYNVYTQQREIAFKAIRTALNYLEK